MKVLSNLVLKQNPRFVTTSSLLQRSLVQQASQARFSSLVNGFTWEKPFLTSNCFVLIENPIDEVPYIRLNPKSAKIHLERDLTLKDLENRLKQSSDAKDSAQFIAPDGSVIAKSTKVRHLLHMPNFVLKLDGHREFNVMSEKSFGLRYQKFTLNNSEKFYYDACKSLSMRDQKAIELSKFLTLFEQELLEN
jgi:hypothetical protein